MRSPLNQNPHATDGAVDRSDGGTSPSRWRRTRLRAAAAGVAAAGALLLVAPVAQADSQGSLVMGPQAMEGNLKLVPGEVLQAGYDFTVPGQHPTVAVTFVAPEVYFEVTCATGTGGGVVTVSMGDATYVDPSGSSAWYPSGDQHSDAVYQGSVTMPDLCGGVVMRVAKGGTFATLVQSDVPVSSVHVRWHYRAHGTSGSWSGTANVTPDVGATETTTTSTSTTSTTIIG